VWACGIGDIRVGGVGARLVVWDLDGRAAAGAGRCGGCCDGVSRVRVLVGLLGDSWLVGLWIGMGRRCRGSNARFGWDCGRSGRRSQTLSRLPAYFPTQWMSLGNGAIMACSLLEKLGILFVSTSEKELLGSLLA
jgi:hypothetical protein